MFQNVFQLDIDATKSIFISPISNCHEIRFLKMCVCLCASVGGCVCVNSEGLTCKGCPHSQGPVCEGYVRVQCGGESILKSISKVRDLSQHD